MSLLTTITQLLDSHNIQYTHKHHPPTPTSEDSARERGEPVEIGGKALVLRGDGVFFVVIISAAKSFDTKKLKAQLGYKDIRFATKEELRDVTGLVPGSVPPIGRPLFDYDCYIDQTILANDKIAFNAGSLTDSLILKRQDRLSVITYEQVDCTKD